MDSADELKSEVDALEPHERHMLGEWFHVHKRWKLGALHQCFVIMPFSETESGNEAYWTAFFEKFLKPALKLCGYEAKRSVAAQNNIVENIVQDLAWSDLVVAVLTDFNPSVWYELGVRHSLHLGTVMVCEKVQIKNIPFDLKHHGFADYEAFEITHPEDAIKKFVQQVQSRQLIEKARTEIRDSPVSVFLGSGLIYCVNKALAWRRKVVDLLDDALRATGNPETALEIIDRLNRDLNSRDIEFTVVCNNKILRHNANVPQGVSAEVCWFDMTRMVEAPQPDGSCKQEATPLYPEMRAMGRGLRLGSISGYPGRITAIAFDQIAEQQWLIVVESHVQQNQIST